MTIKNIKKNISAEDKGVVTEVQSNIPQKANESSNFSTGQTITFTVEDLYRDGDENNSDSTSIVIPLDELACISFIQNNYFDKTECYSKNDVYKKTETYSKEEVDAHIKLHYEKLNELPDMTNKQWATSVRQAGKQNYIFLVPHDDGDSEEYYEEYFYAIQDNDSTFETERMEKIGSTKMNLTDFLKKNDLDTELQNLANSSNSSGYKTLVNKVSTLEDGKVDKNQSVSDGILTTNGSGVVGVASSIPESAVTGLSTHTHGIISRDGVIQTQSSLNRVVLIADKVGSSDNYEISYADNLDLYNIDSANMTTINDGTITGRRNDTLSDTMLIINDNFSAISNIITDIKNTYQLKGSLRSDVWGSSGFTALQDAETDANKKAMKLGEYIYQHLYDKFYTKTEVSSAISQNATTIVDNLTTNNSTQALSAKQGKVLNDSLTSEISRIETKFDNLIGDAIDYING